MHKPSHAVRRCQHIKVNGEQCGSPALKGRRLCFFHNRWRETRIPFNKEGSLHFLDTFDLPALEDAESVQVAIMQVLRLIIAKHIDPKTAGLLLYGLQTASINLRHTTLNPEPEKVVIQPSKVRSIGLRENAWTPPTPPVEEMSREEREKLAAAVIEGAENGQIDGMQAIRMWARISGWDKDENVLRDMEPYKGPLESETPGTLFEALGRGPEPIATSG